MTPARRIARVQRWLAAANGWHPSVYKTHVEERKNTPSVGSEYERFLERLDRANRLFAAELAWLAEYAKGLRELVDNAAAFANIFGLDVQSFDYRAQGDLQPKFLCAKCHKLVPWSEGAADDELCDYCWKPARET